MKSDKVAVLESITPDESKRLKGLEEKIDAGKRTFMEVGLALEEIRTSRLYRAEFKTFQDYCETRWDFTRQRADQLMWAAGTVKALPEAMQSTLCTEKAALALRNVISDGPKTPKMRRVERMLEAAAKKKERVTSRNIEEAAGRFKKPLPKGGLCADAIRAQRGEPETPPNPVLPPEPVKTSKPAPQQAATLTLARCQELVAEIERMIPEDADHDKFGHVLYRAAERQMNWKKAGKPFNPYAGKR